MLLDINCLLAIAWPNHQHHTLVSTWFEEAAHLGWKTCAVTELGFIRLSSNPAFTSEHVTPPEAINLINKLRGYGKHAYLESPSPCIFKEMESRSIQGHRQVTDSYLIALARANDCQLATLDKRLQTLPSANGHLHMLEETE